MTPRPSPDFDSVRARCIWCKSYEGQRNFVKFGGGEAEFCADPIGGGVGCKSHVARVMIEAGGIDSMAYCSKETYTSWLELAFRLGFVSFSLDS